MDPVLDVCVREPIMDPVLDVCVRRALERDSSTNRCSLLFDGGFFDDKAELNAGFFLLVTAAARLGFGGLWKSASRLGLKTKTPVNFLIAACLSFGPSKPPLQHQHSASVKQNVGNLKDVFNKSFGQTD